MSLTRTLLITALTLTCVGCSVARTAPSDPPPFAVEESTRAGVERGRVLATAKCQSCHAVGPKGDSALAAAPPLRDIADRYPPTQLQEAFGEGVVTGHPAMPQFEFKPAQINDLIAYMDTLRSRGG